MNLRERFDRVVTVKASIGIPFTMEHVADTLEVESRDLRSSWLVPFRDKDIIRNIGTMSSRNKKHKLILWSGTYYLDLEIEEAAEAAEDARELALKSDTPEQAA